MVNSGLFGSDENENSNASPIQADTRYNKSQSSSPITASSATHCDDDSKTLAVEPTPSKTDLDKTGLSFEPPNDVRLRLFCSVPLDKVQTVITKYTLNKEEGTKNGTLRKVLCLYCDRTFVNVNLKHKHIERCHSSKQMRRVSLRKSQNVFTSTPCIYCNKFSSSEHTLEQLFEHLITQHANKYFGCLACGERYLNLAQLREHNRLKHGLEYSETSSEQVLESDSKVPKVDALVPSPVQKKRRKRKNAENKLLVLNNARRFTRNNRETKRSLTSKTLQNKQLSLKKNRLTNKKNKRLEAKTGGEGQKQIEEKKETKTKQEQAFPRTTKVASHLINSYPASYFQIKKITDHSIDNLKISSLTFDDVFDKAFFNRIKCNIQENLLHHIDGKLFKNEESETRISNFEKNSISEVQNLSSENFGCELSLNAVTPSTLFLSTQFGEDPESQIEYGAKPSKKRQKTDQVHYKYFTRRKYQASILEHKENRDLSKLDMWTQYVIKNRQQKVIRDGQTQKEMSDYLEGEEYKNLMKREELDRILDRRGPFEDLREEANKQAAQGRYLKHDGHIFSEVSELLNELLNEVVRVSHEPGPSSTVLSEHSLEIPSYLNLRPVSDVTTESEIDKSDRIALICSSQETENFEHPDNTIRDKNERVELTGEWARSRIYVCAACGIKLLNIKQFLEHKSASHQYIWVQHYEFVGNQSELCRHLSIPVLGKVGVLESTLQCKVWKRSDSRLCTKCGKQCNSLGELHRHVLECGGDWTWMLVRKKCKYKPFGSKSRRKRRGLVKRIYRQKTDTTEKRTYKKRFDVPRQKPSDAETIKRMLANLPAKRSTRKVMCLSDQPQRRQRKIQQKFKCGKLISKTKPENPEVKPEKQHNGKRRSMRCLNKVLSSRILDNKSSIRVKTKMRRVLTKKENVTTSTENKTQGKGTRSSPRSEKPNFDQIGIKRFFPVNKKRAKEASKKNIEVNEPEVIDETKIEDLTPVQVEKEATKQRVRKRFKCAMNKIKILNAKQSVEKKEEETNPQKETVDETLEQLEAPEAPQQPVLAESLTRKNKRKRKLARGLDDCIAMLTSKLEKTAQISIPIEETPTDFILKVPLTNEHFDLSSMTKTEEVVETCVDSVPEVNCAIMAEKREIDQNDTEAELDLSLPKADTEEILLTQELKKNLSDSEDELPLASFVPVSKLSELRKPVDDIILEAAVQQSPVHLASDELEEVLVGDNLNKTDEKVQSNDSSNIEEVQAPVIVKRRAKKKHFGAATKENKKTIRKLKIITKKAVKHLKPNVSALEDALSELTENVQVKEIEDDSVYSTNLKTLPVENKIEEKVEVESTEGISEETEVVTKESEVITEERGVIIEEREKEPNLLLENSREELGDITQTELRRSRRNSKKVTCYNEVDLVDPMFDDIYADKNITKFMKEFKVKRKSKMNKRVNKIEKEVKLDDDPIFDLLKQTPEVNLEFEKPPPNSFLPNFEEVSNDFNDDNFDVLEDILQKSMAVLEEDMEESAGKPEFVVPLIEEIEKTEVKKTVPKRKRKQTKRKVSENVEGESEVENGENRVYCEICDKSFIRLEYLVKHKRTLTHISKLSELEAKAAAERKSEEFLEETGTIILNDVSNEGSKKDSMFSTNDSSNLADIINDVLNKPREEESEQEQQHSFTDIFAKETDQSPINRRCKSLAERKCFEPDAVLEPEKEISYFDNEIPVKEAAGIILEKQISLLENIIENRTGMTYIDEISITSNQSQSIETEQNLKKKVDLQESFLKPSSQYEEISEDSNLRIYEEQKSRKVLNRDEELFLECCSLLKSSSELSCYSKKSNNIGKFLGNFEINPYQERSWISENYLEKKDESFRGYYSDDSRGAASLCDNYSEDSVNATTSSPWHEKEEATEVPEESLSFRQAFSNEKPPSSSPLYGYFTPEATETRTEIKDLQLEELSDGSSNNSKKVLTKGALKVFEGLKVSIPIGDLNMSEILGTRNVQKTVCTTRVNKRMKIGHKNVTGKSKIPDVYDFEETQDNSDIFTRPDFRSFRSNSEKLKKVVVRSDEDSGDGISYDAFSSSTSSISEFIPLKPQSQESITKKKCMIMGRIFKNAAKSKTGDEDIRIIPELDNTKLVQDFVLNCHQPLENRRKMTEEELNTAFDKLLENGAQTLPETKHSKKRSKLRNKKRAYVESDSSDDEFQLQQPQKRKTVKGNKKVIEDSCINLEQELKECIGVASRKSQRKCTSGKQNVLIEYWSSDESAFETLIAQSLHEDEQGKPEPQAPLLLEIKETKIKEPPPVPPSVPEKKIKTVPLVSASSTRRKRKTANPLYHWSSSSEDESRDLIEVRPLRDEIEDDDDRPMQHGWIVGDSPKKLVTMLAQAKGKKCDTDTVKEFGKRRTSAFS